MDRRSDRIRAPSAGGGADARRPGDGGPRALGLCSRAAHPPLRSGGRFPLDPALRSDGASVRSADAGGLRASLGSRALVAGGHPSGKAHAPAPESLRSQPGPWCATWAYRRRPRRRPSVSTRSGSPARRPGSGPGPRPAAIHPGSSDSTAHKRWSPAAYGRFARALADARGIRSLVTWGPARGEREIARAVVDAAAGAARLAPETPHIPDLAALLAASPPLRRGRHGSDARCLLGRYAGAPDSGAHSPGRECAMGGDAITNDPGRRGDGGAHRAGAGRGPRAAGRDQGPESRRERRAVRPTVSAQATPAWRAVRPTVSAQATPAWRAVRPTVSAQATPAWRAVRPTVSAQATPAWRAVRPTVSAQAILAWRAVSVTEASARRRHRNEARAPRAGRIDYPRESARRLRAAGRGTSSYVRPSAFIAMWTGQPA